MIYNSRNYQSLLARNSLRPMYLIYNSRNYQSLLACDSLQQERFDLQQQKLLELTSLSSRRVSMPGSTIVEIIRAYQPFFGSDIKYYNLQQQKLLEPTSRPSSLELPSVHLQQQKLLEPTSLVNRHLQLFISTIVEIIRAYQPPEPVR